MQRTIEELTALDIGTITPNAFLREHSWWRIGGPADLLIEPHNVSQVQMALVALRRMEIPYVVMGAGSNLLFDDSGVRGAVIKIGSSLSDFSIDGVIVKAKAGVFVPRLVRSLGKAGLSGLEHAIGIPGTLGGLIAMNGGSQRNSIGASVSRVTVLMDDGRFCQFDNAACAFAYRTSAFLGNRAIIVGAELSLRQGDPEAIRTEMLALLRSRRKKFPLKHRSCGSVFLSDPAIYDEYGPPGFLIEKCGYKGLQIGKARIPELHANFVVNLGGARSSDVVAIIKTVKRGVRERIGCDLQCEVQYVTPDCRIVPADHT